MRKTILFVNENQDFINQIRANLDPEFFTLYHAVSAEEALTIIDKQRINMVLASIVLPDLDILSFLKKVKAQFPLTIRLVLGESTKEDLTFKLFNNNLCKYLISKPVDTSTLIRTINSLFTIEEKLNSKELLSIINTIDKLPVLPDTYLYVNEMIEDEEDINDIAEIIQKDVSMSLKLLQIVNSGFYRMRTGSVKIAITTLGLINIKNILLTTSLFDFFDNNTHKKKLLWKHALTTNKIVIGIYKNLLKKELSSLYASAGMLHDVGKIVLLKNYPENYMKIFSMVENTKVSFTEAENEVLKISNGEIGAYLLTWWDIPTPIVEAALYHETPMESSDINRDLISVVHIASFYAWQNMNIITGEKLDENVFGYLGVTKEKCEEIVKIIINEMA